IRQYVLQDFNIVTVAVLVGIPCLLFEASFGGYHWYLSSATGVPATAGTIIVAALPIILGFQLLLTAFVGDILSQPAAPLIRDERITEIPLHAPDHGPPQA